MAAKREHAEREHVCGECGHAWTRRQELSEEELDGLLLQSVASMENETPDYQVGYDDGWKCGHRAGKRDAFWDAAGSDRALQDAIIDGISSALGDESPIREKIEKGDDPVFSGLVRIIAARILSAGYCKVGQQEKRIRLVAWRRWPHFQKRRGYGY